MLSSSGKIATHTTCIHNHYNYGLGVNNPNTYYSKLIIYYRVRPANWKTKQKRNKQAYSRIYTYIM